MVLQSLNKLSMERYDFKSVGVLGDSMSPRKSRDLSSSSAIRAPFLAPVFRHQKMTDFSISRILGLEDDETQNESKCSGKLNFYNLI